MKTCPACSSNNVASYIKVADWTINECFNCGVLYTVIVEKGSEEKENFYRNEYISAYILREKELKNRFKQHLSRIEKYKHGGNLLDLGCGIGYFIEVATLSNNYFWKTTGLELNKSLIIRSKSETRYRITNGSISKLPFRKNSFDCITCFDVLEHDVSLKKNLFEIKKILKKGGIVVIQAPNYKSLMAYWAGQKWDWWAPADHILHFSFNFLITLLKENDFEILEACTYESTKEFLLNIRARFRLNIFSKVIFFLIIPVLVILERIGWLFNYGALTFVVAKKK